MAVLTTRARKALPQSTFGLPGRRAYPMPDRAHAANAKARAAQQLGKSITSSQEAAIDAKANKILGKRQSTMNKIANRRARQLRGR